MPRRVEGKVIRVHVMLYEDDYIFLQEQFGPGSASRLGVSKAIRKILSAHILPLKERIAKRMAAEQVE
jgi:hypothetical protein